MNRARLLRCILNIYPPYLGTGIVVRRISPDFREAVVEMKLRWYNRNYVKTHFGGSLYSMTDPFYMLMLIHVLGSGYRVWDRAASIEFVSPGTGSVSARFMIGDVDIEEIQSATASGGKYLKDFPVEVVDAAGAVVARVVKTIYIRKRPAAPGAAGP